MARPSITHLVLLALATLLTVDASGAHAQVPARHGKRGSPDHARRADPLTGIAIVGTAATTAANAPAGTSTTPAGTTTSTTALSIPLIGQNTQTSTTPAPVSVAVTVVTSTSTPPTTTSSTVATTSSHVVVVSSQPPSVINLTRTSFLSAQSQSATVSAAAASTSSVPSSSSSGIGKGTIIAIVVVASSCAGVFLIWTAFRRWKLKPTRGFEDRLQPIDFGVGSGEKYGSGGPPVATLNRSGSSGSNDSDRALYRQGSWGSGRGSHRGHLASERGATMSDTESRAGQMAPAYPPAPYTHAAWHAPAYAPQSPPYQYGSQQPFEHDYGNAEYSAPPQHPGMTRSDTIQSSLRYGGETYQHRY